jgi:nicotinamide-nucleotide amidase
MKASILTIGDELLIGQVINTNAAWIAAQLTHIGVEVVRHVTCADDDVDIMRCLNEESQGVQLLILTGGLGPTHDDRTKHVLATWYGCDLVEDEVAYDTLVNVLRSRGRTEMLERNREQASVPSACTVLVNRNGTAPGMLFDDKNLLLVSLPGVPSEMKDIMTTSVLPIVRQRVESEGTLIRYYRTIHTVGIAEAYLADMLSPLEEVLGGTATLAFLPNVAGVRLRIGVPSLAEDRANEALDTIEGKIRERLPDHAVFGTGDTTLAEEVVRLLQVRGSTIAVAESCTAGLLGAAITDVPGASQVFPGGVISYANSIKHQFLDVDESILQTAGAVSSECAVAMAEGVRRAFATTYGVAITGVAGPDGGSPEKPVGTVWIAVATHGTTRSAQYRFGTDRSANRQRSVMMALAMIWQELRGQHA